MTKEIDFTNCKIIKGKFYNGANGKKINYYDFINNYDANLKEAIINIVPRIDVDKLIISLIM